MCTIGVIRNSNGKMIVFKTMDQVGISDYPDPEIDTKGDYAYLGFATMMSHPSGVWAGINERGLALVGADGNAVADQQGRKYKSINLTLYAYREVLAGCADIHSGIQTILKYYQGNCIGGSGDIIILADRYDAVAIEYLHPQWGLEFLDCRNYLVRTNFFNNLRHLRPAPEDNSVHCSSALRFQRAYVHLSLKGPDTDEDDVENLMRDHVNGPSALSICRHGGAGEYITRCATIFTIAEKGSEVRYIVNGTPCDRPFSRIKPDWSRRNLTPSN